MRYLKLTVAYDGTKFVGWQVQKNGKSIQGELERAWRAVTGEEIRITGSGRTDSGVHAIGQVASLCTGHSIPASAIALALNAHLPNQISVIHACQVQAGFHAIRDATAKTYRYTIQTGPVRSPFLQDRCWFIPKPLDCLAMERAGQHFIGTHDFASFQSTGAPRKTTVRTISQFTVQRHSESTFPTIDMEVTSNGFLYNMVRNLVGTLVEVGRGKITSDKIPKIIVAADRAAAGPTAPAAGLTMTEVRYESSKLN